MATWRKIAMLVTLVLIGPTVQSETLVDPKPPDATEFSYLRTPETIADLPPLIFEGREGWEASEVTFGIRDGHLFLARFLSTPPNGLPEYIDDSEYAEVLVEDTANLSEKVTVQIGQFSYTLRGFTLGRAITGETFVDWAYLIGPDGEPRVSFPTPPHHEAGEAGCVFTTRVICFGALCSSQCTIQGSDPCDCSGIGFCVADFLGFRCENDGSCEGSCQFIDHERCGCFIEDACFPARGIEDGRNH